MITRIKPRATAPATTSGMQLARLARRASQPTYELSWIPEHGRIVHSITIPTIERPLIPAREPHEIMADLMWEELLRRDRLAREKARVATEELVERIRHHGGDLTIYSPFGDMWFIDETMVRNHFAVTGKLLPSHEYGGHLGYADSALYHSLFGNPYPSEPYYSNERKRRAAPPADLPDIGDAWLDD